MFPKKTIQLDVNGKSVLVEVDPDSTLVDVLRETLGLTGTKKGCGKGECGSCTVLIDGKAVNACLILAARVRGKILTIEGLSKDGRLDPIQKAFIDHDAIHCGFCTPGMILSAKALLDQNKSPSEEQARRAIVGNLCRCTGYEPIVKAIIAAARDRETIS